jgi:hypothetical protein
VRLSSIGSSSSGTATAHWSQRSGSLHERLLGGREGRKARAGLCVRGRSPGCVETAADVSEGEADLRAILETLDPDARDTFRRALIQDQADRDAIASSLLRFATSAATTGHIPSTCHTLATPPGSPFQTSSTQKVADDAFPSEPSWGHRGSQSSPTKTASPSARDDPKSVMHRRPMLSGNQREGSEDSGRFLRLRAAARVLAAASPVKRGTGCRGRHCHP